MISIVRIEKRDYHKDRVISKVNSVLSKSDWEHYKKYKKSFKGNKNEIVYSYTPCNDGSRYTVYKLLENR